jgi:creatinine amidohydrolase
MKVQRMKWHRYEELRPDQLSDLIKDKPIAYWPLSLLEHHGWHLPVGFDGVKADRICQRLADQTGGVILPVMWWGGLGGHGDFMWTLYQDEAAARQIVTTTVRQLIRFGFTTIVLLMGHYPWEQLVGQQLLEIQSEHHDVLLIWGTEASIGRPEDLLPGDHAALEETSYGLALLPELVDTSALTQGRQTNVWPQGKAVSETEQYPGVRYDPTDPLFAQMGEDAHNATAERGNEALARLISHLVMRINRSLG